MLWDRAPQRHRAWTSFVSRVVIGATLVIMAPLLFFGNQLFGETLSAILLGADIVIGTVAVALKRWADGSI